jgi:RNA polymerase sigma factor (sigma-70 family)
MSKKQLEELYAQQASRLIAFVRTRMAGSQVSNETPEDLLQETFYSLLAALNYSTPIENLTAYVYQSLKNRIVDSFRKRKLNITDGFDVDEIEFDEDVMHYVEQEHLRRELTFALSELPVDQCEVFLKNELEGLSYKEISQQTGVPINTLLSQKRYAIQKLQVLLSDHD